jgi:hypothetical protein
MISRTYRPNILSIYSLYSQEKVDDVKTTFDNKKLRDLSKFKNNLEEVIRY